MLESKLTIREDLRVFGIGEITVEITGLTWPMFDNEHDYAKRIEAEAGVIFNSYLQNEKSEFIRDFKLKSINVSYRVTNINIMAVYDVKKREIIQKTK